MDRRTFLLLTAFSPVLAKEFIAYKGDVYLTKQDLKTLILLDNRLQSLKKFVGFSNFNIISYDEALYYGRNYSKIGSFTKDEQALIEKLFYSDPKEFEFYGEQTTQNITNKIDKKNIIKIPHSGHFVFQGKAYDDYCKIIKDVGDNLILTSGIRNVMKQLSLYVSKLKQLNGNLTQASTMIAPPAFSYHTIKDFDIGKKGWGSRNFTAAFATTLEYQKIRKLNYIGIRYIPNNKDGVRYEPWHMKVI